MFSVACPVFRADCRLSLVAFQLSPVTCPLLRVAGQVLIIQCPVASVQCPVPLVACGMFRVACCLSRGNCSLLRVTCYVLRVACCVRGGALRRRKGRRAASLLHRNQTFRWDCLLRSGTAWRTGAPQRLAEGASEASEGEGCGEALLAPHGAFLEGWAGAAQIEPGFDHGTG
jgi:hypothetical protein